METVIDRSAETIGEIVTADLRKAPVFRKYGIDFCCGGKKTVGQVCKEKNIDQVALEKDLSQVNGEPRSNEANADQWEPDFLAEYIVNVHHAYVRQSMPYLLEWSKKVAMKHGERFPQAIEINVLVNAVAEELDTHMMKEENILFPYIKELSRMKREGRTIEPSPFGTVANPIRMMEHEHESVGELFMQLEKLTNMFTPPMDACNTHRALYVNLQEFENDLFLHIHLESNILFKKAVKMEQEMNS